MVLSVHSGFGRHYELYGPRVFPVFFRHLQTLDITYAAIQTAIKLSMLALYLRLFGDSAGTGTNTDDTTRPKKRSRLRTTTTATTLFLLGWFVASAITATLQCDPTATASESDSESSCGIASRGFPWALWAANMVTNLVIIALPLRYIQRHALTAPQKSLLLSCFGAGVLVCAVSVLRFLSLVCQSEQGLDFTWDLAGFGVWTMVECNLGIVVGKLMLFLLLADSSLAHEDTP